MPRHLKEADRAQRQAWRQEVEFVGANQQPLRITGGGTVRTAVQLDPAARRKVSASLMAAAETAAPDRVFLNLENVRGLVDSTAFNVYVSARTRTPASRPIEEKAGSIALFGVRKATQMRTAATGSGAHVRARHHEDHRRAAL